MNWKNEGGDWRRFRQLPGLGPYPSGRQFKRLQERNALMDPRWGETVEGLIEVDFHWSDRDDGQSYSAHMGQVYDTALDAIRDAYEKAKRYVLFRHGSSTSEGWKKTTSRSVVRALMRSPAATPYIIRRECIQHYSVFIAAIRPKDQVPGRGFTPRATLDDRSASYRE